MCVCVQTPAQGVAKRNQCSLCCGKGPLLMRGMLERTGYCCGENIRLKVEIQNGGDQDAWAKCQLLQVRLTSQPCGRVRLGIPAGYV